MKSKNNPSSLYMGFKPHALFSLLTTTLMMTMVTIDSSIDDVT